MSALSVLDHYVNAFADHDERADQARELRSVRDKFAELVNFVEMTDCACNQGGGRHATLICRRCKLLLRIGAMS